MSTENSKNNVHQHPAFQVQLFNNQQIFQDFFEESLTLDALGPGLGGGDGLEELRTNIMNEASTKNTIWKI